MRTINVGSIQRQPPIPRFTGFNERYSFSKLNCVFRANYARSCVAPVDTAALSHSCLFRRFRLSGGISFRGEKRQPAVEEKGIIKSKLAKRAGGGPLGPGVATPASSFRRYDTQVGGRRR